MTDRRCTCVSQEGKKCKHIYALINYVNNDQSISQTSLEKQWGAPSANHLADEMYAKGVLVTEISPGKKRYFASQNDEEFDLQLDHLKKHIKRPCILTTWLAEYQYGYEARLEREAHRKRVADEKQRLIAARCDFCISILFNICDNLPAYNFSVNIQVPQDCYHFYSENVILNTADIKSLCVTTLDQWKCDHWHSERFVRISAGKRAHNIKTQSKISMKKLAQNFLQSTEMVGKAKSNCEYGNENEPIAIAKYQENIKKTGIEIEVVKMGLVVAKNQNWLCCSPDGIVLENGEITKLLEVKCPSSIKTKPVIDKKTNQPNIKYLQNINGTVQLKSTHMYYTQCQVQMYVTGIKSCDLYIYSPKGSCTVIVSRDEEFLGEYIPKMEQFYFHFFLPALVEVNKENNNVNINNK